MYISQAFNKINNYISQLFTFMDQNYRPTTKFSSGLSYQQLPYPINYYPDMRRPYNSYGQSYPNHPNHIAPQFVQGQNYQFRNPYERVRPDQYPLNHEFNRLQYPVVDPRYVPYKFQRVEMPGKHLNESKKSQNTVIQISDDEDIKQQKPANQNKKNQNMQIPDVKTDNLPKNMIQESKQPNVAIFIDGKSCTQKNVIGIVSQNNCDVSINEANKSNIINQVKKCSQYQRIQANLQKNIYEPTSFLQQQNYKRLSDAESMKQQATKNYYLSQIEKIAHRSVNNQQAIQRFNNFNSNAKINHENYFSIPQAKRSVSDKLKPYEFQQYKKFINYFGIQYQNPFSLDMQKYLQAQQATKRFQTVQTGNISSYMPYNANAHANVQPRTQYHNIPSNIPASIPNTHNNFNIPPQHYHYSNPSNSFKDMYSHSLNNQFNSVFSNTNTNHFYNKRQNSFQNNKFSLPTNTSFPSKENLIQIDEDQLNKVNLAHQNKFDWEKRKEIYKNVIKRRHQYQNIDQKLPQIYPKTQYYNQNNLLFKKIKERKQIQINNQDQEPKMLQKKVQNRYTHFRSSLNAKINRQKDKLKNIQNQKKQKTLIQELPKTKKIRKLRSSRSYMEQKNQLNQNKIYKISIQNNKDQVQEEQFWTPYHKKIKDAMKKRQITTQVLMGPLFQAQIPLFEGLQVSIAYKIQRLNRRNDLLSRSYNNWN